MKRNEKKRRKENRSDVGMSNSGTWWEYEAGWDEDNMTDQGMN